MTTINAFLADRGIYMLTLILLSLGVGGIIVCSNYMKKLICMNVMQVAVIFFFLCLGQKTGGTIPVALSETVKAADYINPLPHGLMLTAIVVSLGTTGVGLSLLLRIYEKYGTLEEDHLLVREHIATRFSALTDRTADQTADRSDEQVTGREGGQKGSSISGRKFGIGPEKFAGGAYVSGRQTAAGNADIEKSGKAADRKDSRKDNEGLKVNENRKANDDIDPDINEIWKVILSEKERSGKESSEKEGSGKDSNENRNEKHKEE